LHFEWSRLVTGRATIETHQSGVGFPPWVKTGKARGEQIFFPKLISATELNSLRRAHRGQLTEH
jgi:hypothetical protein